MSTTNIKEKLEFLYQNKFSEEVKDANTGIALREDIKPLVKTANPIVTYTNVDSISITIDGKEYLIQKQNKIEGSPEDYIYASIHILSEGKDTFEYKYKRDKNEEYAIEFNITNPSKNRPLPENTRGKEKYNEMVVGIVEEIVTYIEQNVKKKQKPKKKKESKKDNNIKH